MYAIRSYYDVVGILVQLLHGLAVDVLPARLAEDVDEPRLVHRAGDDLRRERHLEQMRKDILLFIQQTTPVLPQEDYERETQPTLGFQRVLQRAVFHVQSSGQSEVTGANVLVAIFSEQESQAAYFLKKADVITSYSIHYTKLYEHR